MVKIIERGTACLALRTSSDMWTTPSKPGRISAEYKDRNQYARHTNESPSRSQHSKVKGDEFTVPSRLCRVRKEDKVRIVSRSQGDKNNREDDKENDVHDPSGQLKPRDQPEGIHVHQANADEQCPHNEGEMPSFWCVSWDVLGDQGLQEGGFTRSTPSKGRHPGEPGDPAYAWISEGVLGKYDM